jgi:hypothetical protein
LQGDALDRLALRLGGTQAVEPVADQVQVQVLGLAEGVEGDPEPEAAGQRDALLDPLAGVDLAVYSFACAVVRLGLREQVAAVGGGVDQQVVRGC